MKKTCISSNWHLKADQFEGDISLPNDYSVTQPRNPHALGGAANGFFEGGRGVYTKSLPLPEAPRHYILDIDGAYMCTSVLLNNSQLVMHPHGYAPLLVDLTPYARFGSDNSLKIITDGLQPSTRWYAGAGIYRDIFLWEGGDIRIEPWDCFVHTPALDQVQVELDVTADRCAAVKLKLQILDREGHIVAEGNYGPYMDKGKNHFSVSYTLPCAHAWQPADPYLYTLRISIFQGQQTLDSFETRFGIRTIYADAKQGFLLNGQPMKLRGGCIHHDHGVLGAADYPAACRRKLTRLQQSGFNALRIAHNPPSLQLLEMCDEMGILVMDEAFDCWRLEKGGNLNYHKWFDGWWQRDLAAMVLRDRNHPCVLSFSIGNEIPESEGLGDGAVWARRLADEIRKYDTTHFVTSATYQMGEEETWADRTEGYWKPLDICGYNYLYKRYEKDHARYPDRVIWGSETHAIHFYDSWHTVLRCPYVLGDFTWTAYDNLGEAGTGNFMWARDGVITHIQCFDYPWRSCYQGDLDLCGYRRPQSYFREAVWLGHTEPRIFTTHPEHTGEGFSGTEWHWYDVLDTWTFDSAYLGKPTKCEVYTDADRVDFYLNGQLVGSAIAEKAIASLLIPYEPGTLSVIAYKEGQELGRSSLHTVGAPAAIKVEAETPALLADNRDLCYLDLTVVDANGDRVPDSKLPLTCRVEGGELLGIFSGDPANEDCYGSDSCHAFMGRAVAIIRTKEAGKVSVTISSPSLQRGTAHVTALKA